MTAMAVFAPNYSSLQIETPCITEAARTVMTLGLHKGNLDHGPHQEGRRALWVVYCLEKEYAFNSSNASLISDMNISCPLPTVLMTGSEELLSARSSIESTYLIAMNPFTPLWILGVMPMVAMFIVFDFMKPV
ncbi:hypothetical protein B0I35DRAFT_269601 [Stachybotrys elegans]|uniref:Transcription factor domain-containing protein n=1 Tax=Stachybotrys elegans TaxID=80388 RepID=A0A8K0SKM7_9HYPO|nr:hypothetical protein B0I35DRAFT_269601 [Stachybotrys elegans]